jgi:predicted DNA-binding transcriptional regulator
MNKDQVIGAVILVASVIGLILYTWLLYAYPTVVLQITAFVAVATVLVIFAWIGWTMATTPPPAPLEPIATETQATPSSESEPSEQNTAKSPARP